ncbi:XRE family transcriptional regulator [Virgibacillus sp. LDC-1]|uniref:helix-turn-helix domain-containing protein n=1 Tax=Virgibacillus sp. LDC-1 TaxID=3039856 RepID=UPI0024DE4445|nr:XRE family transcriptional regulator [Virgibacillus sp. LDC-1]
MKEVYEKIKKIRKQLGMTLKDLSEATDLSISFLSQVERGTSNLALSSLKKIADAFEINISEFFDDRKGYSYVTRHDQQQVFQVNGLDTLYANLGGNFDKRVLAPYILILDPNQKKKNTFKFAGEEFYYVLKGAAKFIVDDNEYHIFEGDSIHFPSHLEHYGENLLDEETHLLGVITPVVF